ncbi:MAG: hypothetical protein IT372_14640 [Polyangiaceae bacterium]|nr:hypothetical protein [Polyangiaceae bacterium]
MDRHDGDDQTAERLARSLESTSRGLSAFAGSVQALKDALKSYQQMQLVLMQQRLWAQRHGRAELDALFRRIAGSSSELHAIFSGFAAVMDVLRSLERLEPPAEQPAARAEPGPRGEVREPDEALLHLLSAAFSGVELTPGRRTEAGRWRRAAPRLEPLVRSGMLEPSGGGYRLTASARRRLAITLVKLSDGQRGD